MGICSLREGGWTSSRIQKSDRDTRGHSQKCSGGEKPSVKVVCAIAAMWASSPSYPLASYLVFTSKITEIVSLYMSLYISSFQTLGQMIGSWISSPVDGTLEPRLFLLRRVPRRPGAACFHRRPCLGRLTVCDGKPACLIGKSTIKGPCSIAFCIPEL